MSDFGWGDSGMLDGNGAERLKLVSGRANIELAEEISEVIGVPLCAREVTNFSDGEIFAHILENVRGHDVFVIQPTSCNVNDNLMELLIIIDALKRASAKRITATLPYFGYGRQDRKVQSRTPITSKLIADQITTAGADRVLTMDLHAGQIQGFFSIPVDHLYAMPILTDYIKKQNIDNLMFFSPDAGGVERARAYARALDCDLGIIDKRRERKNVAEVVRIVGDVEGKNIMIVDDIVDTAGTLTEACKALLRQGAKSVSACVTHGVLSGPALERIAESPLKELITTNSIALTREKRAVEKITFLSIAKILGEAILRIHCETSISSLFESDKKPLKR